MSKFEQLIEYITRILASCEEQLGQKGFTLLYQSRKIEEAPLEVRARLSISLPGFVESLVESG